MAIRSYIGATNEGGVGQWKWSDGSAWGFDNWGRGHPNGNNADKCVMVETMPFQGNSEPGWWNELECDVEGDIGGYICSFDIGRYSFIHFC